MLSTSPLNPIYRQQKQQQQQQQQRQSTEKGHSSEQTQSNSNNISNTNRSMNDGSKQEPSSSHEKDGGADSSSRNGDTDANRRVKIYELTLSSTWEDKGTGFVSLEMVDEKHGYCIVVRSEEDNRILLETMVHKRESYQRQQVWTESDGRDLALSFQLAQGCLETCDMIYDIQTQMISNDDLAGLGEDRMIHDIEMSTLTPPPLELDKLGEFEKFMIQLVQFNEGRDRIKSMIMNEGLMDKIFELFDIAEEKGMEEELKYMYNIARSIVITNDHDIFTLLLKDKYCQKFCALFEHDPEYPIPKGKYRSFLAQGNRFKKVCNFRDPNIEQKIHETYRAQYLKDVVLARIVDDPNFNGLHSIIVLNHLGILHEIANDDSFMEELCKIFKSPKSTELDRQSALYFIQEFCQIAKSSQSVRQQFYQSLIAKGVVQEIQPFLTEYGNTVRLVVADILTHILDQDAACLRSFVLSQKKFSVKTLTESIIDAFLNEPDPGIKYYYAEILKQLMDCGSMTTTLNLTTQDDAEFIALFYNDHFSLLLGPIKSLTAENSITFKTDSDMATLQCLVEVLIFLIRINHGRMKSFLLRDSTLDKLNNLLHCKLGYMKLLQIRVLRLIIATQDEFFARYVVKNDLLRPAMEAFRLNGTRYNMLNSAVLDLLELIASLKSTTTIIRYVRENFKSILDEIDYVETGKKLLNLKPQTGSSTESSESTLTDDLSAGHAKPPTSGKAWEKADESEDAYFNGDDDSSSGSSSIDHEAELPIDDLPPIPARKPTTDDAEEDDDDTNENFIRFRSGTSSSIVKNHQQSTQSLKRNAPTISLSSNPPPVKNIVDYPIDDDMNTAETAPTVSRSSSFSPRLRNISLGSKRQALDEADPRHWGNKESPSIASGEQDNNGGKTSSGNKNANINRQQQQKQNIVNSASTTTTPNSSSTQSSPITTRSASSTPTKKTAGVGQKEKSTTTTTETEIVAGVKKMRRDG